MSTRINICQLTQDIVNSKTSPEQDAAILLALAGKTCDMDDHIPLMVGVYSSSNLVKLQPFADALQETIKDRLERESPEPAKAEPDPEEPKIHGIARVVDGDTFLQLSRVGAMTPEGLIGEVAKDAYSDLKGEIHSSGMCINRMIKVTIESLPKE